MQAVLVHIDGTIADTRLRRSLAGTPEFYKREELLKDAATADSVRCLRELSQRYKIVYLGARPATALAPTEEWLRARGFPNGPVYLAPTREECLALTTEVKARFDFAAGIGDRWEDNELHLELGCQSIILKEFDGNWDTVRKHLLGQEHTALQTAAHLLAPWAKDVATPEPHRIDVMLAVADLLPAVRAVREARWGYLAAITGLDHPAVSGGASADSEGQGERPALTPEPSPPAPLPSKTTPRGGAQAAGEGREPPASGEGSGKAGMAGGPSIEVLYHFCSGAAVVTLRTYIPREAACVPSICGLVPSAGFFERELSEMLGVTVIDPAGRGASSAPAAGRLFLPDDWPECLYPLRKDFVPS